MPSTAVPPRLRLPWIAALLTLATATVLLFGPLWDDAEGENPLTRPTGPDWSAILALGLPTLMVAASLTVALALPRRLLLAGLATLFFGYVVLWAPGPFMERQASSPGLLLWFVPALVLTIAGFALGVHAWWRHRRRGGAAA